MAQIFEKPSEVYKHGPTKINRGGIDLAVKEICLGDRHQMVLATRHHRCHCAYVRRCIPPVSMPQRAVEWYFSRAPDIALPTRIRHLPILTEIFVISGIHIWCMRWASNAVVGLDHRTSILRKHCAHFGFIEYVFGQGSKI